MPRKKQASSNCYTCKIKLTDTNRQLGKNLRCKSCYNTYMREYFKTNKDKHNEIMKKWRAKNKELVHQMNVNLAIKKFGNLTKSMNHYIKKNKENLTDGYVRFTLTCHNPNLRAKDIPNSLVELKRKQLLLTKEIKHQTYA
jgi:hypothetical protein